MRSCQAKRFLILITMLDTLGSISISTLYSIYYCQLCVPAIFSYKYYYYSTFTTLSNLLSLLSHRGIVITLILILEPLYYLNLSMLQALLLFVLRIGTTAKCLYRLIFLDYYIVIFIKYIPRHDSHSHFNKSICSMTLSFYNQLTPFDT